MKARRVAAATDIARENGSTIDIDDLDRQIINLMIAGKTTNQMASSLKRPLSTIQRRARKIEQRGDLVTIREFNYKKYGYKMGLLHVYLTNGNAQSISEKIARIRGISCVSIHIGNSDIVAKYVCRDSQDMLDIIAAIKNIEGVQRIVWSEQVKEIHDGGKQVEF